MPALTHSAPTSARALLTGGSLLISAFAAPAQTLLWSDEFDTNGSPDSTVWSYDLGASGWGNQELQRYTDDSANVVIEDGVLRITARRAAEGASAPFTSARIKTENKVTIQYGTIEARIKMPDLADGLWPAFWTLGNNFSQVGWPDCGELDVLEMGHASAIREGVINRRVGSTAHWENDGQRALYGLTLDADEPLNEDFHVYRMEWTPSFVTTYLDGEQIWQIDIRPENCTDCTEFHQPHFLILNMAVGGLFTGLLSESQITANFPATMEVDYVRVYDNGFTQLGGPGVDAIDDIGPAQSGSWYNPEQSGHGFSMEFGRNGSGEPLAVIYWYNYDADGNPVHFIGTGTPEGDSVEVNFQAASGMRFGEFDPDTVTRNEAGSATLRYDGASNQFELDYAPSDYAIEELGHSPVTALELIQLFAVPVD